MSYTPDIRIWTCTACDRYLTDADDDAPAGTTIEATMAQHLSTHARDDDGGARFVEWHPEWPATEPAEGRPASTGPEHYREAERLIAKADEAIEIGASAAALNLLMAGAQVHATLAQAAATALSAIPAAYDTTDDVQAAGDEWRATITTEGEADQ